MIDQNHEISMSNLSKNIKYQRYDDTLATYVCIGIIPTGCNHVSMHPHPFPEHAHVSNNVCEGNNYSKMKLRIF